MTPEQKAKRIELERIRRVNNRPGSYLDEKKKIEERQAKKAKMMDMEDNEFPGMWKEANTDFTTEDQGIDAERENATPVKETPVQEVEEEDMPSVGEEEEKRKKSFRDMIKK